MVVYKALNAGVKILKGAYMTFVLGVITLSIVSTVLSTVDLAPYVQNIYNGFIVAEFVGALFYFSLTFMITFTERHLGLEGALAGTEMWQIVRSWRFFKEDILKDALILNGLCIALSGVFMGWMVL